LEKIEGDETLKTKKIRNNQGREKSVMIVFDRPCASGDMTAVIDGWLWELAVTPLGRC